MSGFDWTLLVILGLIIINLKLIWRRIDRIEYLGRLERRTRP